MWSPRSIRRFRGGLLYITTIDHVAYYVLYSCYYYIFFPQFSSANYYIVHVIIIICRHDRGRFQEFL